MTVMFSDTASPSAARIARGVRSQHRKGPKPRIK
jgi:hypothetical protein